VKLSEWARREGVHPKTAYRWFREGTLPVPAGQLGTGTVLVRDDRYVEAAGRTVVYARVLSHDQRDGLEGQVGRVTAWCSTQGVSVDEVVIEVGSGLNGKCRKLARLLSDATVGTIVVEHRDRLARFGVEYLEAALSAQGRRVVVADGCGG